MEIRTWAQISHGFLFPLPPLSCIHLRAIFGKYFRELYRARRVRVKKMENIVFPLFYQRRRTAPLPTSGRRRSQCTLRSSGRRPGEFKQHFMYRKFTFISQSVGNLYNTKDVVARAYEADHRFLFIGTHPSLSEAWQSSRASPPVTRPHARNLSRRGRWPWYVRMV